MYGVHAVPDGNSLWTDYALSAMCKQRSANLCLPPRISWSLSWAPVLAQPIESTCGPPGVSYTRSTWSIIRLSSRSASFPTPFSVADTTTTVRRIG